MARNKALDLYVVIIVVEIWKQGNQIVFRNVTSELEIFTMAKLRAWSWISDKVRSLGYYIMPMPKYHQKQKGIKGDCSLVVCLFF